MPRDKPRRRAREGLAGIDRERALDVAIWAVMGALAVAGAWWLLEIFFAATGQ